MFGFPGGKLEAPSEQTCVLERTVKREIMEEVGLEIGDVSIVTSKTFQTDEGLDCLNIITLCEYEGGTATPQAAHEVAAVHWLSPEKLKQLSETPDFLIGYVEAVEPYRASNR